MMEQLKFRKFGRHAFLIDWKSKIDEIILDEILTVNNYISENFSEEIIETVSAYHSLAIYLKRDININSFIEKVKKSYTFMSKDITAKKNYIITIPVCYEIEYAPDILSVASSHDHSIFEVIKLHTQTLYKVYFLGFLPGFPYLGGLDKRLYTSRKKKPRQNIVKGSIGIGGKQTGIYTVDSPGGWNIIGRSPLQFFNTTASQPTVINNGDYIKFVSISKKQYLKLDTSIKNGNYNIEKEVYND